MEQAITRRSFSLMLGSVAAGTAIIHPGRSAAAADPLTSKITEIETRLKARVGVAVFDDETGRSWQHNADARFPLNSTFKALAVAALLARVDAGAADLSRSIRFQASDILTYSPITDKRVGGDGMTLTELCAATLAVSDNTAANLVLDSIGGPQGFTAFMRSIGDSVTRLDRWETDLNEAKPGDPRDTTTPNAIAASLRKVVLGDVLSPAARQQLTDWMMANRVSDAMLRAGLPKSWRIADRSGAGGHGARSIIAVMWPPSRKPIIAAVYLTETTASFNARNAAIAEIGKVIRTVMEG